MRYTRHSRGTVPLERNLACAPPNPGIRSRITIGTGRVAATADPRLSINRLDVHERELRALSLGNTCTIAALDSKLSRFVVDGDEPVPLLNRQRGGLRNSQANMFHLRIVHNTRNSCQRKASYQQRYISSTEDMVPCTDNAKIFSYEDGYFMRMLDMI